LSEENNTPRIAFDNMNDALKKTRFRGSLIPTLQDRAIGPVRLREFRSERQLGLGL
jgi:hypothetical protein